MLNLDSLSDACSKNKMKHTPILRNHRCCCFPWENLSGIQSPAVQDHRYLHCGWAEYLGTYLPWKPALGSQVPENPNWIGMFRWHLVHTGSTVLITKQNSEINLKCVCGKENSRWKCLMIRKPMQEVQISPQLQTIWNCSSALQEDTLIINLLPRCLFHIFCWIWTTMQAKMQQTWSLHLFLFTVSSL